MNYLPASKSHAVELRIGSRTAPGVRMALLCCRRLWQHVTRALKDGSIDEATEQKHRLEERQRGEEKQRAADSKAWSPKYFTKEVSGGPTSSPVLVDRISGRGGIQGFTPRCSVFTARHFIRASPLRVGSSLRSHQGKFYPWQPSAASDSS